jgi:hypothetical protein
MDFNVTVGECQKKLQAVGYGYTPTAGDLKPYASIDLLAVMDQLAAKVQRSGQPNNPERYLISTLGQELAKRTKEPNKMYYAEGEDLPVTKK